MLSLDDLNDDSRGRGSAPMEERASMLYQATYGPYAILYLEGFESELGEQGSASWLIHFLNSTYSMCEMEAAVFAFDLSAGGGKHEFSLLIRAFDIPRFSRLADPLGYSIQNFQVIEKPQTYGDLLNGVIIKKVGESWKIEPLRPAC